MEVASRDSRSRKVNGIRKLKTSTANIGRLKMRHIYCIGAVDGKGKTIEEAFEGAKSFEIISILLQYLNLMFLFLG